jgi:phosphatidate phosphatase APP1
MWKKVLQNIAQNAEAKFDELTDRLSYRMGMLDRIHVVLYNAYATPNTLYLSGRVLEDKGLNAPKDKDGLWENLLNTYKRLETNEVPHALIEANFKGQILQVRSDEEGYFNVQMPLSTPIEYSAEGHRYHLRLVDFPAGNQTNAAGQEGRIFMPPAYADFGVISDVDDTIMRTNATELIEMAWATFMQNARTRVAFKGVASFYEGLRKGKSLKNDNPFFYVSSSPWNLFDLIRDFISINTIPMGPIMLRDYGVDENKLLVSTHGQHKRERIDHILSTYPQLNFILIGDSGQEDTFIYEQVARDYPNRILAIYIRDAQVPSQQERVTAAIQQANKDGIEMLLVPDSMVAARHAVSRGYMHPSMLDNMEAEMRDEEKNDADMDRLMQE